GAARCPGRRRASRRRRTSSAGGVQAPWRAAQGWGGVRGQERPAAHVPAQPTGVEIRVRLGQGVRALLEPSTRPNQAARGREGAQPGGFVTLETISKRGLTPFNSLF